MATLARRRGRDLRGWAELVVLSEAGVTLAAGEIASHRGCELSLVLDRDDFGPGETVEGTLVATAVRDCKMNELRVELVRHEEVPREEGNRADVKEAEAVLDDGVELSPGAPREWPFRLTLPEALVPSLRTDQTRVTWLVRGVGAAATPGLPDLGADRRAHGTKRRLVAQLLRCRPFLQSRAAYSPVAATLEDRTRRLARADGLSEA